MENIILKFINREKLTQEEEVKLERWLALDKNRKVYNQLKLNIKGPAPVRMEEMKSEVWGDLSSKIERPLKHSAPRQRQLSFWVKVAAAIVFILGFGSLIYFNAVKQKPQSYSAKVVMEKESLYGQKLTFSLPDGTIVKLNAGSRLSYPKEFSPGEREITLVGEAFFDVSRDETKPFIIRTPDLEVQVLGTSFNVRAYEGEDISKVAVATGEVAVGPTAGSYENLLPGNMISYSRSSGQMHASDYDADLELGWKDNLLVFQKEKLAGVLTKLSRWYGVEFVLLKDFDDKEDYSGKYDNPSLEQVLSGLSFVFDLKYSIDQNKVFIK